MRNRTRTSTLDGFGLRDQRDRIYPALQASDGRILDLDFTVGTLDSRITFSRASTATFINSSGLVASASNDVARFDYAPTTLAARGLLIESSATNLLQRSNALNTSPWATNGYTHTTGTTSPHSTESSQRLTVTGSGTLGILQATNATATSLTFSIWWKNGNWTGSTGSSPRELGIRNNTTATMLLRFRIDNPHTTPTIGYITGSSGVSLQNYGNGWYRIVATVTSGVSIGNTMGIYVGGLLGAFIGSGEYADWYGAQLEDGTVASSYIPTVSSQATRAAETASITGSNFSSWYQSATAFSGVIEGQVQSTNSYGRILNFSSGANTSGIIPSFNVGIAQAAANRPFINAYVTANNDVDTYVPVGGAITSGVPFKVGFRHETSSHYVTRGSSLSATSTYAGFAAGLANFYLAGTNGSYHLSTHYSRIIFWPRALPDAQLDVLAT